MERVVCFLLPVLFGSLVSISMTTGQGTSKGSHTSVKFYLHDRLLSKNRSSDSATLSAAPNGDMELLGDPAARFGKVIVFDDPVTEGPLSTSKRVGTAQGFYVYTSKNLTAFWAFTGFFDTEDAKGSLSFMGTEVILMPTRDIPVTGGTGDFMGAQGFATMQTISLLKDNTYFTVSFDVKLWYCN